MVSTLLTFWPPAPPDLAKRWESRRFGSVMWRPSWRSRSGGHARVARGCWRRAVNLAWARWGSLASCGAAAKRLRIRSCGTTGRWCASTSWRGAGISSGRTRISRRWRRSACASGATGCRGDWWSARPGVYDWSLWDRAFEACERHGLEPIVDLCHFGLPDHYRWLLRSGVGRRLRPLRRGVPRALSETALVHAGERAADHGDVLGALRDLERPAPLARGLRDGALSLRARESRGDGADPRGSRRLVDRRGGILVSGAGRRRARRGGRAAARSRVGGVGPALRACRCRRRRRGTSTASTRRCASRIDALATTANVIAGHDFYPVSAFSVGGTTEAWSIADRLDAYEATAARWHARYGVDFWVAETSNLGLPRRAAGGVARARSRGACARCAVAVCWCAASAGTAAAISSTGTRRSRSRSDASPRWDSSRSSATPRPVADALRGARARSAAGDASQRRHTSGAISSGCSIR